MDLSIFDHSPPSLLSVDRVDVSNDEQVMFCSRNGHIQASQIVKEPNIFAASNRVKNDDVTLLALERIDCIDVVLVIFE